MYFKKCLITMPCLKFPNVHTLELPKIEKNIKEG